MAFFSKNKLCPLLLAIFASSVTSYSFAGVGANASVGYIKNPRNVANLDSDPDSSSEDTEILYTYGVNGNYERQTQKFITSLDYSANFYDYKDDLLQDRETLVGRGLLSWIIKPDTIFWNLSHNRNDTVRFQAGPDIDDNREVISVTSTGPVIAMPIGAANTLNLSADYSYATYSKTDLNDQARGAATVGFERLVTENLRLALNGTALTVDFDHDVVTDYDVYSYSIYGSYTYGNYFLSLEVGDYETHRGTQDKINSPLLHVDGRYEFTPSSIIQLGYSETVEDPVSNIQGSVDDVDDGFLPPPAGTVDARLFEQIQKNISYSYGEEGNYTIVASYSHNTKKYSAVNSRIEDYINLSFSKPLGERVNMSVYARYSESNFPSVDPDQESRDQDRQVYGFSLNYLLNSSFNMNFTVTARKQKGNFEADNYDSFRASVGIWYSR